MVDVELTDEDLEDDPTLHDYQEGYCQAPNTVKCKFCDERFKLIYGMEGDEDFDDDDEDDDLDDDDLEIDEDYEDE